MQYSFVRGAPSQPPLFTWESLHYLILELPPLRPSDSSSDSVVLMSSVGVPHQIDRRHPTLEWAHAGEHKRGLRTDYLWKRRAILGNLRGSSAPLSPTTQPRSS